MYFVGTYNNAILATSKTLSCFQNSESSVNCQYVLAHFLKYTTNVVINQRNTTNGRFPNCTL